MLLHKQFSFAESLLIAKKMEMTSFNLFLICENPCTPSSYGRRFYVYPRNESRADIIRGTYEREKLYQNEFRN